MKKGFTLLYAVLFMSLLLTIALSILSLSYKDTLIASIGAQSQVAFYAADAGLDCANYYDRTFDAFSTTSPSARVTCAEHTIVVTFVDLSGNNQPLCPADMETAVNDVCDYRTFTYNILLTEPSPQIKVEVYKDILTGETEINSYGYNNDNTNDPRRLQRALKFVYSIGP